MTTLAKLAVAAAAAVAALVALALVAFNHGNSHRAAAVGVNGEVATYVSNARHLNVRASCHRVGGHARNGADAASVWRATDQHRLQASAYWCVFSGPDWEAAEIGFGNCFVRSPAGQVAATARASCSRNGRSSAATEFAAGRRWQILGHGSALGRNAAASAAAAGFEVLALALQASARPTQPVRVSWNLTCVSLAGPQTASGRFTTRKSKPQIIGDTNGSSCSITATARLRGNGHLKLRILGGD
jgi:hypothetical protein